MRIAILGSTGSIGRQALDVIRSYSELFEVELLTANNNWELLVKQAIEFQPSTVIIANEQHFKKLKEALSSQPIKVFAGAKAIEQSVDNSNIDTVLTAMVGFSGLAPTVAAIKAGKKIALANKETLVVGGEKIIALSRQYNAPIIPVDSEHSAIFQCLVGEQSPINRIIITASGGAVRDIDCKKLSDVTPKQALNHPNWKMGAKITIDSATMLNKGFEIIEAKWLFGLKPEQIEVVIHPESIIHSFVEFEDLSIKAQLGLPDMRMPIQYALTFPKRLPMPKLQQYNPTDPLTFRTIDPERYPALLLTYQALKAGGIIPAIMNAANEVAVEAFLEEKIRFTEIAETIEWAMNEVENSKLESIEQLIELDSRVRQISKKYISKRI